MLNLRQLKDSRQTTDMILSPSGFEAVQVVEIAWQPNSSKQRQDLEYIREQRDERRSVKPEKRNGEIRKKNVVMTDLPIDTNDPQIPKKRTNKMLAELQIEVQVKAAYKVRNTLAWQKWEKKVMENKHKLTKIKEPTILFPMI